MTAGFQITHRGMFQLQPASRSF